MSDDPLSMENNFMNYGVHMDISGSNYEYLNRLAQEFDSNPDQILSLLIRKYGAKFEKDYRNFVKPIEDYCFENNWRSEVTRSA